MSDGMVVLIILIVVFLVGSAYFWYALVRYGEMANDIWRRYHICPEHHLHFPCPECEKKYNNQEVTNGHN